MRTALNETVPVTLDGSGNGVAKAGPLSAREQWRPGSVHVSVSGPVVNEATCSIYVGPDRTQSNFRDTSFFGSSGDSSATVSNDVVVCGQYVWAVWTGGDPGKGAILTITGVKDV